MYPISLELLVGEWRLARARQGGLGVEYLKRETCTRLEGHHIAAGSTRYRRNIPAQPNPSTCVHTIRDKQ
jgi:hypothetical protein